MRIDRLILPVSGMVLQYRQDGRHLVAAADALEILYEAEQQGVPIWSEPDYTAVTAFGEVFPGDVPHPTWWAVVGTAPPNTTIDVTVDDDQVSDPPVYRLADLWACEWIAHPAVVRVHRSDDHQICPIRIGRPDFLPPARYPEWEIDN